MPDPSTLRRHAAELRAAAAALDGLAETLAAGVVVPRPAAAGTRTRDGVAVVELGYPVEAAAVEAMRVLGVGDG
jgi:hypothetical protein